MLCGNAIITIGAFSMATYAEKIQEYERKRRDAERRLADAKRFATSYYKSVEVAGLERMTADQEKMVEDLYAKERQAKADISEADGALTALREAQAEDEAADALNRDTRPTGAPLPGGERTVSLNDQFPRWNQQKGRWEGSPSLYGVPAASDGPVWRYSDTGRPAAVERGQRFGDHELV